MLRPALLAELVTCRLPLTRSCGLMRPIAVDIQRVCSLHPREGSGMDTWQESHFVCAGNLGMAWDMDGNTLPRGHVARVLRLQRDLPLSRTRSINYDERIGIVQTRTGLGTIYMDLLAWLV